MKISLRKYKENSSVLNNNWRSNQLAHKENLALPQFMKGLSRFKKQSLSTFSSEWSEYSEINNTKTSKFWISWDSTTDAYDTPVKRNPGKEIKAKSSIWNSIQKVPKYSRTKSIIDLNSTDYYPTPNCGSDKGYLNKYEEDLEDEFLYKTCSYLPINNTSKKLKAMTWKIRKAASKDLKMSYRRNPQPISNKETHSQLVSHKRQYTILWWNKSLEKLPNPFDTFGSAVEVVRKSEVQLKRCKRKNKFDANSTLNPVTSRTIKIYKSKNPKTKTKSSLEVKKSRSLPIAKVKFDLINKEIKKLDSEINKKMNELNDLSQKNDCINQDNSNLILKVSELVQAKLNLS